MVDFGVPARSSSPPVCETDAELTARFEREALPLLDALYRGALALSGDRLEAEDLLQETMMNAYRRFASFPEGASLRIALYQALTNTYISSCRGRHRQLIEGQTDTITDLQLATAAEHPWTRLSWAEVAAFEALPAAVIAEALQELGRDARMVVYYADVEDFSYQEIAEIINRSVSAVMSLLRRARGQLRYLLLATCYGEAAGQFHKDPPNRTASRPHRTPSRCAPSHRSTENSTCADQLDWFDREIVRYILLWAPHGEMWEEDVYPRFGMTVDQLVNRFRRIIATSVPLLGRLAKSDRELVDKACCLPGISGSAW